MSRSGWQLRLGVVAIAFAAILLRALVPAGYMLGQAETRERRYLVVQLCDAHELAATAIDLDTGKVVALGDLQGPHAPEPGADHGACVFAASVHFATPSSPQIVPPILTVDAIQSGVVVASGQLAQIAALPPATGPPGQV